MVNHQQVCCLEKRSDGRFTATIQNNETGRDGFEITSEQKKN